MSHRARANSIRKVYLNEEHPAGFSSPRRVWVSVRSQHPSITLKEVRSVLSEIESYALHRRVKRPRKTRPYTSPGLNHYFQMDLFVLNQKLARINRAGFVLFAIDAFSKRLFCRKLLRKDGESVAEAIRSIIKENNSIPPLKVVTDKGKEFMAGVVQDTFRKFGITHFTSENVYHAGVVERAIRTLREKFGKFMTHHKTDVFLPRLKNFVSAYNNAPHSALPLGMSPNQVNPRNELRVWKHQFAKHFRRAPGFYGQGDLNVGHIVRITKFREKFTKSSQTTFTPERFVITHVLQTKPLTYKIASLGDGEPISGAFYRAELQPVGT